MLNQYDGFRIICPFNFSICKNSDADQNYDMYGRELLPVVKTMTQLRHYLKSANQHVPIP